MTTTSTLESDLCRRVKSCIIERLELPMKPEEFADDAPLFAPVVAGGLELDSLSSIEIVVGLSREFGLQLDEVPKEAFSSVRTLSRYLQTQLA